MLILWNLAELYSLVPSFFPSFLPPFLKKILFMHVISKIGRNINDLRDY
jgi:hypothetical protein